MKVRSLLLGKYNKDQYFNLYCLEDYSTLLFKFSDIAFLFQLPLHLVNKDVQHYQDTSTLDSYLTTTVLTQLAVKHNKFLLAELCKLKQNDYIAQIDKSILSKLTALEYLKSYKNSHYSITTNIQLKEGFVIKSEPVTPPPISDLMSVNSLLIGAGSQSTGKRVRANEDQLSCKKSKSQHKDQLAPILPKPVHTVHSQRSFPLNKNTRNLTISTPSYVEQYNGIRSAPLHSNFRMKPQQQQQQPHPLSKATMMTPTSSSTAQSEFVVPPIVLSQQQQQPSLQKQQFLQPFEHLFDTIETTRTLKSTLDDQIRRSSTLIQTLQASSSMVEGLVKNQVKEAQNEIMQRTSNTIESLSNRIAQLEKSILKTSSNDKHVLDTLYERLDKLENALK